MSCPVAIKGYIVSDLPDPSRYTRFCPACGKRSNSARCPGCGRDTDPDDLEYVDPPSGYTIFSHAQLGHVNPSAETLLKRMLEQDQ